MRRMRKASLLVAGTLLWTACAEQAPPTAPLEIGEAALSRGASNVRINVLLHGPLTAASRAELESFGRIVLEVPRIDAAVLLGRGADVARIAALGSVAVAELDSQVSTGPLDAQLAADFTAGLNTWNLDAINVTDLGAGRTMGLTGAGVYVGVLDTGLMHTWRLYFPEERIASQYARAFSGGAASNAVPETPNVWEKDVNGHGTHVTSTIIGYSLRGTPINGVAPRATVIPVKVLGQQGSGWSSIVAQGITYMGELKETELSGSPVVINLSLGSRSLSALVQAAIDYAIEQGVIVVAAAGNEGAAGMSYPGGYAPVISAGSVGWGDCPGLVRANCFGQWTSGTWWFGADVAEPTDPAHFYVSSFSSRELAGQELDVLAPGDWVVGPYQLNRGVHASYFYLSGTSMASPHVAGIVALMAEKNGSLTAAQAEAILKGTALPMAPGTRYPLAPGGTSVFQYTWDADATGAGMVTADAAVSATP
jgi:subtilisin family serine protease